MLEPGGDGSDPLALCDDELHLPFLGSAADNEAKFSSQRRTFKEDSEARIWCRTVYPDLGPRGF